MWFTYLSMIPVFFEEKQIMANRESQTWQNLRFSLSRLLNTGSQRIFQNSSSLVNTVLKFPGCFVRWEQWLIFSPWIAIDITNYIVLKGWSPFVVFPQLCHILHTGIVQTFSRPCIINLSNSQMTAQLLGHLHWVPSQTLKEGFA